MAKNEVVIKWLSEPEAHDYPAAKSYLNLLFEESVANTIVKKLKKAPISEFKAKDIFRASALSLLGVSNSHVEKDRQKIASGKEIAPILLVRDTHLGKIIIADGYHRLCAIYSYDEDAVVPCKIV
jgi:predicted nucleic acid-binding protein